jgi:hypothetical protein
MQWDFPVSLPSPPSVAAPLTEPEENRIAASISHDSDHSEIKVFLLKMAIALLKRAFPLLTHL